MLDVDFEVVDVQNGLSLIDDDQQLVRSEPVVEVVSGPQLEPTRNFISKSAAAVDKPFFNARYLRHMCVFGNFCSVGQDETQVKVAMAGEMS